MIILDKYNSAIFIARGECRHKDRKPFNKLSRFTSVPDTIVIGGKEVNCRKSIVNIEYEPYDDGELERIIIEEDIMVYNFLKNKYKNKDYAERFKENIINSKL